MTIHTHILCVIFLLQISFLYAQDETRYKNNEIKVGDRVEVNPEVTGYPWLKGMVTKLNFMYNYPDRLDTYSVLIDGQGWSRNVIADHGHIRLSNQSAVKTNTNGNQPTNENQKQNQTHVKVPLGCTCTPQTNPPTTGAPSAELFKKLVMAQWDKPARPGQDGAVCSTITSFQMGNGQQWRPELNPRQVGTNRLGQKPKTIYPVKVKIIVCTTYNTAWVTTTWSNVTYIIFKDENFGEWKAWGDNGFEWKYETKRYEHE